MTIDSTVHTAEVSQAQANRAYDKHINTKIMTVTTELGKNVRPGFDTPMYEYAVGRVLFTYFPMSTLEGASLPATYCAELKSKDTHSTNEVLYSGNSRTEVHKYTRQSKRTKNWQNLLDTLYARARKKQIRAEKKAKQKNDVNVEVPYCTPYILPVPKMRTATIKFV